MLWALLLLAVPATARILDTAFSKNGYQFALIDSFCFDGTGGTITFSDLEFSANLSSAGAIALYHDREDGAGSYLEMTQSRMSCNKRLSMAAKVLTFEERGDDMMTEEGVTVTTTSSLPRFWYAVAANCKPDPGGFEGVAIQNIKLTWLNEGKHFSHEDEGILGMGVFTLLVLILLMLTAGMFHYTFVQDENDLSHNITRILIIAMSFNFFAVLLEVFHRMKESKDGVGMPVMHGATLVLDMLSQLALVGLFIVLAKGLYITSVKMRDLRSVIEAMVLYLAAAIGLLAWAYNYTDPAFHLHHYRSPGGQCLAVLRLIIFTWFLSSLYTTYSAERQAFKRTFYMGFAVFGTFYLLSMPITCMVAGNQKALWVNKVVFVMDQLFSIITYMGLLAVFAFGAKRGYVKKASDTGDGMSNTEDYAMAQAGVVSEA